MWLGEESSLFAGIPAASLAGVHVVTQLLQLVILGQLSIVADLLEVPHPLGFSKDMQGALLQLEASRLCGHRDGTLLAWVVLKELC